MSVDIADIVRQLEQDPGARAQLRAVLLSEDLLALPERVAELDARLTAALTSLAEAQARTDRALARLTERVDHLERSFENRFDRLEASHEALRTEVGRLSQIVGGTVEEDAASLVETVLTRRGWQLAGPPSPVELNGEIDVLAHAEDEAGRPVAVLAEAKVRLRPADVRRFASSLPRLLRMAGVSGEHVAYVYGFRIYEGSVAAAEELGLGVLSPDGERLAPRRSA